MKQTIPLINVETEMDSLKTTIVKSIMDHARIHGVAITGMKIHVQSNGDITGFTWSYKTKTAKGVWK